MDYLKTPAVSVLMPVYNGRAWLAEAIESVLGQSMCDLELIIINDGSTDDSPHIARSFVDERIRYVDNPHNMGLVATLNRGVSLCRGRYTARMDADDVCERGRLEAQMRFMERNPKVGACGTWGRVIDSLGHPVGRVVNQTDPAMIDIGLLFSVPMLHPSAMIRTQLLRENPYADIPLAEDYELWCRLACATRLANLPRELLRYRWHTDNVSKQKHQVQSANTLYIIKGQLARLGLSPDDEQLRIHRLSFTLHRFDVSHGARVDKADLHASAEWFSRLIEANRHAKIYDEDALTAFLWGRWMVLCRAVGSMALIPPFASMRRRVLRRLAGQLWLLAKK